MMRNYPAFPLLNQRVLSLVRSTSLVLFAEGQDDAPHTRNADYAMQIAERAGATNGAGFTGLAYQIPVSAQPCIDRFQKGAITKAAFEYEFGAAMKAQMKSNISPVLDAWSDLNEKNAPQLTKWERLKDSFFDRVELASTVRRQRRVIARTSKAILHAVADDIGITCIDDRKSNAALSEVEPNSTLPISECKMAYVGALTEASNRASTEEMTTGIWDNLQPLLGSAKHRPVVALVNWTRVNALANLAAKAGVEAEIIYLVGDNDQAEVRRSDEAQFPNLMRDRGHVISMDDQSLHALSRPSQAGQVFGR